MRRRTGREPGRRYMNTDRYNDEYRFDMDEVERIERGGREALSNRRESLGGDAGRLANRGSSVSGARNAESRERRGADPRYTDRGNARPGPEQAPARRRRSEVLGAEPERYDETQAPRRRPAQQRPAQQRSAQQRPAAEYRRAQD
ncbi:MAG: hypothetical protein II772_05710, partial [Lachnospiraceae bacterium]|nr:hypothetical protein [Lachnospiraceae bacterium]